MRKQLAAVLAMPEADVRCVYVEGNIVQTTTPL